MKNKLQKFLREKPSQTKLIKLQQSTNGNENNQKNKN